MKDQDHANGWACSDCLMLLANGETPTEMSETETAEYLDRIERHTEGMEITLGRMFGEDGCEHTSEEWQESSEDHSEGCEQVSFSWSACDVCNSRLGGSRGAVTFWFPATV